MKQGCFGDMAADIVREHVMHLYKVDTNCQCFCCQATRNAIIEGHNPAGRCECVDVETPCQCALCKWQTEAQRRKQ